MMSDTSSSPPNKNLETLTGIRQVHKRDGGIEYDIEVEAAQGRVRLHILAKDVKGFPGIILNCDPHTATTLGVSLLAKSEEASGNPGLPPEEDPFNSPV
jgi:hypothetical protein